MDLNNSQNNNQSNNQDQNNRNTNRKIWVGTGIFIIVIAVFCAIAILMTPSDYGGSFFITFGGKAMLRNTTELDIRDMTGLEAVVHSEDIYFYESNNSQLVIKEYYRSDRHRLAEIHQNGDRVSISGQMSRSISLFSWGRDSQDRVEIYLPRQKVADMSAVVSSGSIRAAIPFDGRILSLESTSGSISWEQVIRAEDISIISSSGSIRAEELIGDISVRATSGSIRIGRAEGPVNAKSSSGSIAIAEVSGDTTAEATSGSIRIEAAEGFVNAGTSSGSISISGLSGGADACATSGSVRLEISELSGDINAETSSGSVSISLPRDSEFNFQAQTQSGSIKTDFDDALNINSKRNKAEGIVGNNPEYRITAQASSGGVRVKY